MFKGAKGVKGFMGEEGPIGDKVRDPARDIEASGPVLLVLYIIEFYLLIVCIGCQRRRWYPWS